MTTRNILIFSFCFGVFVNFFGGIFCAFTALFEKPVFKFAAVIDAFCDESCEKEIFTVSSVLSRENSRSNSLQRIFPFESVEVSTKFGSPLKFLPSAISDFFEDFQILWKPTKQHNLKLHQRYCPNKKYVRNRKFVPDLHIRPAVKFIFPADDLISRKSLTKIVKRII